MSHFDLAPYRPVALHDLVRVGRDHDGGYVVSRRSVAATRVLVGIGISADWSFEEAFVRANPAVRVLGVDGSVSGDVFRGWVTSRVRYAARAAARGQAREAAHHAWNALVNVDTRRRFLRFFDGAPHRFTQRFLGDADSPAAVTWETLAVEHGLGGGAAGDVFLKMDIEGAEYDTLDAVLAHADRFAGAVVEFHDLGTRWARFVELMAAFDDAFAVAHLHGNNWAPLIEGTSTPTVLEVSFVSRRLLGAPPVPSTATYPRPGLDLPCKASLPDYVLEL